VLRARRNALADVIYLFTNTIIFGIKIMAPIIAEIRAEMNTAAAA
jgi:hypothetical protein